MKHLPSLSDNRNPLKNESVLSMVRKINELGGLQFTLSTHKDGWTAECKNLPGILTGDTDPHPSLYEVDKNIKDAIFTAFGIPPEFCDDKVLKGPFDLEEETTTDYFPLTYIGHLVEQHIHSYR